MKASAWVMVVLMFLLVGCFEIPHPVEPLDIPPASEIEYVEVTRWKSPDGKNLEHESDFKIWGRQRIEELVAELRLNNADYSSSMRGRAPQEYSIALNGRETMKAMIWVGSGWLGGVDENHKDENGTLSFHYRKLDPEQYTRLVALVRRAEAE